ncbi:MAG: autotransporter domain-containing protein, partial [Cucumibacter sp.]
LILTGASTYSGITTISGGTLQIGDGGTTGSLAGAIVDNATLVFNRSDALTYAGVISGTGGLTQAGAGTLTLTGANTYTGNTTISGGTLQIDRSDTSTYGGVISGGGALTKSGAGTLTLTGNSNAYSGITTISGGTLQIGNGGTTGSLAGNIVDDGALVFNRSNNLTYAGVISGGGTLTKSGAGMLTLTGDNIYSGGTTISGGTLQIGSGATGSLAGDIVNDAALVVNRTGTLTYDGVISGGGTLTKSGSGTLILTGASTYSGITTISGGGLLVDGSILGPVAVLPGALLGGVGSLGTTTIDGALSPGNAIGTLTINGDLSFGAGGAYLVEVAPTSADRTNVAGVASLGGTVQVTHNIPGTYAPGVLYTILSADSLSGSFAGLDSDFGSSAFIAPALTYDANNVYFSQALVASFASVGETRNQIATGAAVDTLGFGNPVFDALVWGTADDARTAFDALSGEIHASVAGGLLDESHNLRNAITGRLSLGCAGSRLFPPAPAGPGTPDFSESGSAPCLLDREPAWETDYHASGATPERGYAIWTQAISAHGFANSDGNAASLKSTLGGVFVGLDAAFGGDWRLGVAGGYTQSGFDVPDRGSIGSSKNFQLALYGGGRLGPLGLRLGATHAWHVLDIARTIVSPDFTAATTARYDAYTDQIFGEIGYGIALKNSTLEPFAGLAYASFGSDRFTEVGGPAALSGNSQFDAAFGTLGIRAATTIAPSDLMRIRLHGAAAWRHTFGDTTPEATAAFLAGSAPYSIGGAPIAKDVLAIDAGFDFAVGRNARLGLAYTGQFAPNAQDQALKVSFNLRF